MEELKAQAEALGIKVDGRWSEERLQDEIDKALEAPAVTAAPAAKSKATTVTNLRANANKRLGLAGFGSVVLTADQLGNKQLMARIAHGVETGVLSLS